MERAALVKNESNVGELEKKINSGQIEEVIIQAENELKLSRKILEWKSWEPLVAEAPANQWKWPWKERHWSKMNQTLANWRRKSTV